MLVPITNDSSDLSDDMKCEIIALLSCYAT